MEENGCVFLPAAGGRSGSTVSDVGGLGYYWSSTSYTGYGDKRYAYDVYFYSALVYPNCHNYRHDGYSVRLITECQ